MQQRAAEIWASSIASHAHAWTDIIKGDRYFASPTAAVYRIAFIGIGSCTTYYLSAMDPRFDHRKTMLRRVTSAEF